MLCEIKCRIFWIYFLLEVRNKKIRKTKNKNVWVKFNFKFNLESPEIC